MLIDGEWVEGQGDLRDVTNPYDGSVIGAVPLATPAEIDRAIAAADRAFSLTAQMPAHERSEILLRTSALVARDREEIARTIAMEAGKALKFARIEADRGVQTFRFAAAEAKRLHGETVPMDAVPGAERRMGFWYRVPRGPVAAISPFNFPLNLLAHKVAPALAAGNSLVVKPPSPTPLTALHLGRLLLEAGVPRGAVNIVTGEGGVVGDALVSDPRIQVVSFTGSPPVGRGILARAGLKRVILELGNNSAVIVAADADLDKAFPGLLMGTFSNSGQVCISVQRIYVHQSRWDEFIARFVEGTESLVVGDPLDDTTDVGPMIDEHEALRAEAWIDEAKAAGARVLTGGGRMGAVLQPTVVVDATPDMKIVCREVFAPVVTVTPFTDMDEAFRLVNDSAYGLQAGVYTESIDTAFRAVRGLQVGGVIVNDSSNYRVDHMPYGGVKHSGLGREGLRFAVEEMTELKMVVFNL